MHDIRAGGAEVDSGRAVGGAKINTNNEISLFFGGPEGQRQRGGLGGRGGQGREGGCLPNALWMGLLGRGKGGGNRLPQPSDPWKGLLKKKHI